MVHSEPLGRHSHPQEDRDVEDIERVARFSEEDKKRATRQIGNLSTSLSETEDKEAKRQRRKSAYDDWSPGGGKRRRENQDHNEAKECRGARPRQASASDVGAPKSDTEQEFRDPDQGMKRHEVDAPRVHACQFQ